MLMYSYKTISYLIEALVLGGGRASFKKLNAKRDNVKNITIHKVSRVQ